VLVFLKFLLRPSLHCLVFSRFYFVTFAVQHYVNDLCSKINHRCFFFLFTDGIKLFIGIIIIITIDICLLLQKDINSVQNLYTANHMNFNTGKTNVLTFSFVLL
jgi:hypothetical protein